MIKKLSIPIAAVLCFFLCYRANAQIMLDSTVLDTQTVITGLDIPWEIQWGPDNWIWMTERYGRVSRVDPQTGTHDVLLVISEVYQASESGLLGMVLHPSFNDTAQLFLVYTYLSGGYIWERLVRYEYSGGSLINPTILIDSIPGNTIHDGSRLMILPDRTILMTTGDANNQPAAQDPFSLNGKVLRLNLDGSIPSDNPFPGNPVWSWGHRNAQGIVLAPNGKIYSSEHGPTSDDEINILTPARNYGWPNVMGPCDNPTEIIFCLDSNVYEPITYWSPTIAPADLLWYNHTAIPEFNNTLLLTVLKDKRLIRLTYDDSTGTNLVDETHFFINTWGRLRDICVSPEGVIYLATSGQSWQNTNPFTHSIVELRNPNPPDTTDTSTISIEKIFNNEISAIDIIIKMNPVNELGEFVFPDELIGQEFEIVDVMGKSHEKHYINQKVHAWFTDSYQAGIYFLVVNYIDKVFVKKLVVQ